MNQQKICTTCGTQFSFSNDLPELCPVCNDDRQYIPETGQTWVSPDDLSNDHSVDIKKINNELYGIKLTPSFAIGQRAILVITPGGNILWDCIPLLNQQTVDFIKSKGGLKAIAVSHPHYYSNMHEWATVFNCAVYIHKSDEQWIMGNGNDISLWTGAENLLWDNIKIINTGGHFPGSCILHIPLAKGIVLCGDSLQISRSRRHIGIMYSYPNLIPLPLHETGRIKNQVMRISFDSMYGAFDFQNLPMNARDIFVNSMEKYSV